MLGSLTEVVLLLQQRANSLENVHEEGFSTHTCGGPLLAGQHRCSVMDGVGGWWVGQVPGLACS